MSENNETQSTERMMSTISKTTETVVCTNCGELVFKIQKINAREIKLIVIQCISCRKFHPLIEMKEEEG